MSLAIANRYANALAAVLLKPDSHGAAQAALGELRGFVETYRDSGELRNVLSAPSVPAPQKRALISSLGERLGLSKSVRNLLFVLSDNHRLGIVGELVDAFEARLDEARGVARIEVVSAAPLDDAGREAIIRKFSGITGKPVEAVFSTESELLGGVVVRVGGTVYDGSLRSQLSTLSRAMAGAA